MKKKERMKRWDYYLTGEEFINVTRIIEKLQIYPLYFNPNPF